MIEHCWAALSDIRILIFQHHAAHTSNSPLLTGSVEVLLKEISIGSFYGQAQARRDAARGAIVFLYNVYDPLLDLDAVWKTSDCLHQNIEVASSMLARDEVRLLKDAQIAGRFLPDAVHYAK
jgi:hypothetical protein